MTQPKKIDFNQLPKKFCEGAIGTFKKEIFIFSLRSGNNLDTFATTPQMMKNMAVWIQKQVANYEEKFGEIDMTPPKIQSPIQAADLQNPGNK